MSNRYYYNNTDMCFYVNGNKKNIWRNFNTCEVLHKRRPKNLNLKTRICNLNEIRIHCSHRLNITLFDKNISSSTSHKKKTV